MDGKKNIIWIDDEFSTSLHLANQVEILQKDGFGVDIHETPNGFITSYEKNPSIYACVIIDLVIFKDDWHGDLYRVGFDLIKKVRSINQKVKIIAYSRMTISDDDHSHFAEDSVIYYNSILHKDIAEKIKNLLKDEQE